MSHVLEFAAYETRLLGQIARSHDDFSVVYDIGASNGSWANAVAKVLPNAAFHLFEPQNEPYLEVRDWMLRHNPNFILHNIGLGDETGSATMCDFPSPYSSTFLPSTWDGVKGRRDYPIWRLDEYVAKNDLPDPDIIKMDVQGFELKILHGAEKTLATARILLLETWLYRGYGEETPLLSEIIEWLEPRGFVVSGLGDMYFNAARALRSVDAVFIRADFAPALAENALAVLQGATPP